MSKRRTKNRITPSKVTWGRDFSNQIEWFLNDVSYLLLGSFRMLLKTGGLISSNLIDIGFGSVVWGLVLHDYQEMLPFWFTTMVGVFISLVMTRAQIYFNEEIFKEDVIWTPRLITYTSINALLTLFDTILDVSILAYLMFNRSPLDLFEIVLYEQVPRMFWVFAAIVGFLSMFGDAINMMFFTEHNKKEKEIHGIRTGTETKSPRIDIPRRSSYPRYSASQFTNPSGTNPSGRVRQPETSEPVRGDLDY